MTKKHIKCTRPSCQGLRYAAEKAKTDLYYANNINKELTEELKWQKTLTEIGFSVYLRDNVEFDRCCKFKLEENGGICGIYMLMDGNHIIYIGQSIDIFGRISNHRIDKIFNSVVIIYVDKDNLNSVENFLIRELNPELNVVGKISV